MTNCSPHRPEHDTVGRHSGDVASAGDDGGSKSKREKARTTAERGAEETKTARARSLHAAALMPNAQGPHRGPHNSMRGECNVEKSRWGEAFISRPVFDEIEVSAIGYYLSPTLGKE